MERIPGSAIVFAVLSAVSLLCFLVLTVHGGGRREVEFPPSGLSDSIFELQNMTYEKSAGLSRQVQVGTSSYLADACDGKAATVGELTLVECGGHYCLYASLEKGQETESVLSSLCGILSPEADPLLTKAEVLSEETGYLHGCHAVYGLFRVTSQEGRDCLAVIYRLTPYGQEDGQALLVGCVTFLGTTQGLADAAALAGAVVGTVRPGEGGR